MLGLMWWGVLAGILAVGILSHIPREMVLKVIGKPGGANGILRAAFAGLLLDLCSHGILLVGTKLYERGASFGQMAAFLIASPWNSFSLTLILLALVGWKWTVIFILASFAVAIVAGYIIQILENRGKITPNPSTPNVPSDYRLLPDLKRLISEIHWNPGLPFRLLSRGFQDGAMILRWMLFGIVLASAIRALIPLETYQAIFAPTLLGLGFTLLAATIIEVCSEGATPIAADILKLANAPGNAFAFLMAGVATDITEILAIRGLTGSWRKTLIIPLFTLPQILLLGYLMNQ